MITAKELQVLQLKQKGMRQIDIAKKLKITQPAVSRFYTNALEKIKDAQLVLELAKKEKVIK